MDFPIMIPFENEWWTFCVYFIAILILVGLSDFTLKKKWFSPQANRKCVHLIVGLATSTAPFIFTNNIQAIALAIIFIVVNAVTLKKDLFKGIHSQERFSFGTVYFPGAYLILVSFFWTYSEFVILSMVILAISDPLAAIVGESRKAPKNFTIWKDIKSIQGSTAFFLSAFAIVFSGISLLDIIMAFPLFFSLFVAFGATLGEMVSNSGSDNVSIPVISILFMIFYSDLSQGIQPIQSHDLLMVSVLFIFMIVIFSGAYALKSVSRSGYYGGLIMGTLIIFSGGIATLYPLFIFFILSSILSKVIKKEPEIESKGSERDIIQVYANGLVPLLISLWMYFNPNGDYMPFFLASVTAAMADTWATELGKLSKRKPVSILTFKTVPTGASGGITLTGTIGSLLGASIFIFCAWLFFPIYGRLAYGIIACGFLGSIIDSILGATIQAKYQSKNRGIIELPEKDALLIQGYSWINNDMVNLLSTAITPLLMGIYLFYK